MRPNPRSCLTDCGYFIDRLHVTRQLAQSRRPLARQQNQVHVVARQAEAVHWYAVLCLELGQRFQVVREVRRVGPQVVTGHA